MRSTCHKLHEGAILNLIALHICDTQRFKKIEKNSIANLRVIEKRPVVLTANKEIKSLKSPQPELVNLVFSIKSNRFFQCEPMHQAHG